VTNIERRFTKGLATLNPEPSTPRIDDLIYRMLMIYKPGNGLLFSLVKRWKKWENFKLFIPENFNVLTLSRRDMDDILTSSA
jgi:hypothetical protein